MKIETEEWPVCWAIAVATFLVLPFFVDAFTFRTVLDGTFQSTPFDAAFVRNYYHSFERFSYVDYNSAVVLLFLVTLGGLGLLRLPPWGPWALRCVAAVVCVMVANLARNYAVPIIGEGVATAGSALLAFGAAAILHRGTIGRGARKYLSAVGTMLMVLLVGNVAVANAKLIPEGDAPWRRHHAVPAAHESQGRRLVVVLLDEWDYRLTFEKPELALHLPAIERLRRESAFLTNAQRAGPHTTLALPTLLTGQALTEAKVTAGAELTIAGRDRQLKLFRLEDNLFAEAVRTGRAVAVVANPFHPYCRLFAASLASCWGQGVYGEVDLMSQMPSVLSAIVRYLPGIRRVLPNLGVAASYPPDYPSPGRTQLEWSLAELERRMVDPQYQFVFAHLLTPHVPYFWDRRKNDYISPTFDSAHYIDQIEYVDRTIGRLMAILEASPLKTRTDIVFMTDHNWRKSAAFDGIEDTRVPFIVHIGGGEGSRRIDSPVNLSSAAHRLFARLLKADQPMEMDEIERELSGLTLAH